MAFNIVGIGEVLWDLLPEGRQLGGAPANFAYHAQSLGANATVITRVGKDADGAAIQSRFSEIGLSLAGLQQDEIAPTGTVSVALGKNGVPSYTIQKNVAWDYISATRSALECVGTADVVCFGSLAQRHSTSRHSIQTLVSSAPNGAWRVFDVNLRQNFYTKQLIECSLGLANVLKLNDQELPVLTTMFALSGDTREQIRELSVRFDLRVVALTCGPNGSLLYCDGHFAEGNPSPIQVKDTVGAGDAFTAALCMGLLTNLGLDHISTIANRIAAHVCGCTGAMPPLPADLRQLLPPAPHHAALTPTPEPNPVGL
jgi:fructokinase